MARSFRRARNPIGYISQYIEKYVFAVSAFHNRSIVLLTMSSKASRKAALAQIREAKRKRIMGEEDTDELFDSKVKEEEDVFDVVDEDEYQKLVNSRREREDFVVDDGE